jgi:hypothetical protein
MEGTFALHYRIFSIFNLGEYESSPVLFDCFGSPFRVYSTKDFPGLEASTPLTNVSNNLFRQDDYADEIFKHLATHGIRVQIRAPERRNRPKK